MVHEGQANRLHHLCLGGLVDPFLHAVLCLQRGPFSEFPFVKIDSLLGTK